MKKLFIPAIAAAILASCANSPEKQAKQLIEDYITTNANNPDTYESVSFGSLDSTFSSYYASDRFKELDKQADAQGKLFDKYMKENKLDSAEIYLNEKQRLTELITSEAEAYKGEHFGWKMKHTYRAANNLGAIIIADNTFYFDKEITKITDVK